MAVTINGTTGIANDGGYTGDGVVFADTTPANTLVTTTGGNVGIGTSSPNAPLNVVGAQTTFDTNVFGQVLVRSTAAYNATPRAGIVFSVKYNSAGDYIAGGSSIQGYKQTANNGEFANGLLFTTQAEGSAPAERARIDSSGSLLVGATSKTASETLKIVGAGSSGGEVARFENSTNTSGYSGIVSSIQQNGNNTSTWHFRGNTNNVANWYLYGNGTISYSSDARLKKNIETTRDGYLEDLCKLRVVKYNWRNDAEDKPKELGLIAQEVEQVFAGLVQDDPNKISKDDDTVYKQIKGSVLPFMLLKAIQEQQAIITSLTARVTALEGA